MNRKNLEDAIAYWEKYLKETRTRDEYEEAQKELKKQIAEAKKYAEKGSVIRIVEEEEEFFEIDWQIFALIEMEEKRSGQKHDFRYPQVRMWNSATMSGTITWSKENSDIEYSIGIDQARWKIMSGYRQYKEKMEIVYKLNSFKTWIRGMVM